jgi:tetratricopeptide (TPR) repeat protein
MKSALALLSAAAVLLPTTSFTQVLPAGGAPAQQQQPAGGGGTDVAPQQKQQGNQQMLGGALPFMDASSGTVAWDGKMWNVTNNRMFRARLEKYLASPEGNTPEDQAYRKILDEITTLLAPGYNGGKPDVPAAVALLPIAAQYDIDANLCDTLANAIWGVWLSTKNVAQLRASIAQMQIQKDKSYFFGERGGLTNKGRVGGPKAPAQGQQASQPSQLSSEVRYIKDIIELEARMKANELSAGTAQLTAKAEFQAIIIQFAIQRRFEHVVMACRFYRHIFADPSGILQLKQGSDAEKMFASSLGTSPTISALDAFANESIRDVDEAVQAFDNLVARGDVASASERIGEAYMVGEYLPRVRRVPMQKKLMVLDFTRDQNQLLSCMEMKDYTRAEELVTRIMAVAKDFDPSKPLAMINTAKTVSEMQLNKAKAALMQSDQKGATEALTAAVHTWPTNPRLKEFNEMTGKVADVKTQAVMDFDKLLGQKNYRQIFNDQGRYSAAVMDDEKRKLELADVLTKMNKLLVITSGANSLLQQNNSAGAWETVEKAFQEFPEDNELSRMRSDLSVKASEFVGALQRAKQHEERQQIGSALAWYLKARSQYPPSSFATEGVNRQVEKLKNVGLTVE